MKELLTHARNLHHLIVVLAIALLPIAPSRDEVADLTQAINELTFWQSYSHPNWAREVVKARDEVGNTWREKAFPSEVIKRWEKEGTKFDYALPVITYCPEKEAPLRDHLKWARGFDAGNSWLDFFDVPAPTVPLSKGFDDVSSLIGIDWNEFDGKIENVVFSVALADRHPIVREWGVPQMPTLYPREGSTKLVFAMKVGHKNRSEDGSRTFRGDCGFSSVGPSVPAPIDLLTDDAKKILVPDGKRDHCLPFLSMVWEDVQHLSPAAALHYLREQREKASGTLDVLGVKIYSSQLRFAGPLGLAALLAYLLMHVGRALRVPIPSDGLEDCRTAWGAVFPGLLSRFVAFISLVIVPTAVSGLIANRTIFHGCSEVAWVIMSVLLVGGLGVRVLMLSCELGRKIEQAASKTTTD